MLFTYLYSTSAYAPGYQDSAAGVKLPHITCFQPGQLKLWMLHLSRTNLWPFIKLSKCKLHVTVKQSLRIRMNINNSYWHLACLCAGGGWRTAQAAIPSASQQRASKPNAAQAVSFRWFVPSWVWCTVTLTTLALGRLEEVLGHSLGGVS